MPGPFACPAGASRRLHRRGSAALAREKSETLARRTGRRRRRRASPSRTFTTPLTSSYLPPPSTASTCVVSSWGTSGECILRPERPVSSGRISRLRAFFRLGLGWRVPPETRGAGPARDPTRPFGGLCDDRRHDETRRRRAGTRPRLAVAWGRSDPATPTSGDHAISSLANLASTRAALDEHVADPPPPFVPSLPSPVLVPTRPTTPL